MSSLINKSDKFLFHYNSIWPFTFLRISLAFFCLIYFICLANEMHALIGFNGYIGREVSEATINSRLVPRISWLINPLVKAGCSDEESVSIIMWIYLLAILCMLAGLFTRIATLIVCGIHLMIFNSTEIFSYGVDAFMNILLFYSLLMPAISHWSLDNIVFKRRKKAANVIYKSFFVRVLQIHICIAYFFGGISKLIMPGWLSGNNIWQTLMLPHFKVIDFSFLANHPFITTFIGWIVVTLELFYPLMMCFDKTRKPWLMAIISMHIFIGCFMSLPFFGLIMIIFNMAAFGWNDFYPFLSKLFKRGTLLLSPIASRS
jgi:hypothetical protein